MAYYVRLHHFVGQEFRKAQLSSLSLLLRHQLGEAGTGTPTSRMVSSPARLVAPCTVSFSSSGCLILQGLQSFLWPGRPGAVTLSTWCLSALQAWAFQESQRFFTSVLEVTSSMSQASHLGQPRVKEREWTPQLHGRNVKESVLSFIPSTYSV